MTTAALYARVSTGGQLENTSPDAQLARARAYCLAQGYDVVDEKIEAMGGTFVMARSKYNDLLNQAADGELEVIVADIPDRLGRGDAIPVLEHLAKMNGARVEYAQPGRDANTVEGLAMKATDQLVSGIERLNIRRRTMDGRNKRALAGRIIATANRPYGYRYVSTYNERGRKQSCVLEVVPEEAGHVREMYAWLGGEGMTLRAVARRLNDAKVPTMKGTGGWWATTVHDIVASTVYRGEWRYGKAIMTRQDTPEGIKNKVAGHRSGDDVIKVPCPAIVSGEMWDAAQDQLAENVKKFVKPTTHEYLLRGRVQCAICERLMVGHAKRKPAKEYCYYTCPRSRTYRTGNPCPTRLLPAELAERLVWETVMEALREPERIVAGARIQRQETAKARQLIDHSLAALEVQAAKDIAGLDRVFEMVRDGDAPKAKYREEKARVEARAVKREGEAADLRARAAVYQILSEDEEAYILDFARQVSKRLRPGVPFPEKVRLLDLLRVTVSYDDRTGDFTVSGLMGTRRIPSDRDYSCVRYGLPFSVVYRITHDGKAERLADSLFSGAGVSVPGLGRADAGSCVSRIGGD